MIITRPKFVNVPLKDGLRWSGGGGWRYEEKLDGVWSVLTLENITVAGELMKDGRFFAFDLLSVGSMELIKFPLHERLSHLEHFTKENNLLRPAVGHGAEFLEAVLARGGEGVVAKQLDAPFGAEWYKCKRIETFDLIVTDKIIPSIRLSTPEGEDRGWCPCKSAFDSVKIGDVVEVAAYSLTAKGKLREPRFIRVRHDKIAPS